MININDVIKPSGPTYEDVRGNIKMILEDTEIHSVSVIDSHPNATRATHWHAKDSHYCLVSKGEIHYYERPFGSKEKPTYTVVREGQLFYTAPMVEHEMYFISPTQFYCFSTLSRKNKDYEKDTTRLSKSLREIYEGR